MMKVGYDAQAFLSPNGGTGKGLQLKNLLGANVERFIGFASNSPNPSGIKLVQEGKTGYNLWQIASLPTLLRRHQIDVFLAPYNIAPPFLPSNVTLILVLHDMILLEPWKKEALRERVMDLYRRYRIPGSVRRARIVLTVSEYSRREILERFPDADVRVIPCTIGREWFLTTPVQERGDYVLMVTSPAPHKNVAGGMLAYAKYAQRAGNAALRLKVVGLGRQAAIYKQSAAEQGVDHLIDFQPFLTERELQQLYMRATAVLFPSFSEGFGIPMLESMASGTPLIAARATCLPEIGGEAPLYADPSDPEEMARAIETVVSDVALQREMGKRGICQAKKYHPDRVGRIVEQFWKELASE